MLSKRRQKMAWLCDAVIVILFVAHLTGCGPTQPTAEELAAFERANPLRPRPDVTRLTRARLPRGTYRVVSDDVLVLTMPATARKAVIDQTVEVRPLVCRVDSSGTITLPVAGEVEVAGKTLSEIESAVIDAYYPTYLKHEPPITVRVAEYQTRKVSVVGVVNQPGTYDLRSDEMSLVSALMKAGGIAPEGAEAVRIRNADGTENTEPLLLPVNGLDISFADVALSGGETIEVRGLDRQTFSVVGLVERAGVFPYPPGVEYNLAQALAAAGGVYPFADPKYAKICRQDETGKIIAVPFAISHGSLSKAANVRIRPGDVIAVEQTAGTDTRMVLMQLLRFSAGASASN